MFSYLEHCGKVDEFELKFESQAGLFIVRILHNRVHQIGFTRKSKYGSIQILIGMTRNPNIALYRIK